MCLKILWAHSNYWKQACLFKCNRRVYIWKQWWYNDNIKKKRYEKVLADLLLMQKHILKSINTIYNYSAKKPLVLIIQIKKWLKLIVPRKKIKSDNSTKKKTNNANNTNKNITNANNANKKITNANNANKKSLVIIALRKKSLVIIVLMIIVIKVLMIIVIIVVILLIIKILEEEGSMKRFSLKRTQMIIMLIKIIN